MVVTAILVVLGASPANPLPAPETSEPTAADAPASVEPVVVDTPTHIEPPRFVEPRRPPARDRRPHGRTTQRFTDRPPLLRPALRLAPGFSARLTGRPYAAFGLDVLASLMIGLHGGYRQWGLAPEAGYSLRAPGSDHRLLLGMGVINGINAEGASVGWLPRAVLYPEGEALGLGVRNGLWFDLAENGFSFELSHQVLRPGGDRPIHELQVTLGIDVAMLVLVLTDTRMAWL